MPIRVLIIDDSRLVRGLLQATLSRFSDLEIVGEAGDGQRGEQLARTLRPDVITMDVLMPMMGGIEAIEIIMREQPTPIVVVADLASSDGSAAMEAMARGAVAVFPKPRQGMDETAARALADVLRKSAALRFTPSRTLPMRRTPRRLPRRDLHIVGIVSSTGGPRGLRAMLQALSPPLPFPIAIVQHTTPGSTAALAAWLSTSTPHRVSVAQAGQRLLPGDVVVAPEDRHLTIDAEAQVRLLRGSPGDGYCPSGGVLLGSLAKTFGAAAAGVVLSGMGSDGASGLAAVEAAGGLALIEDPGTAVVSGMPSAALAATRAALVDTPDRLAMALRRLRPGAET
ncbi:MAG TPA: chemotaxis protein CheB [Pseudomonadota bacterium]|nr:chemotaxis protein CheB [Pseudomonadota bacterium]